MSKVLKFLVTELLYNGHLQSLGAVGIVYAASFLALNEIPSLDLLIVTYLVYQFIYYFDRFWDLERDKDTNKERSVHLSQYSRAVPFLMVGIFLVIVSILILFSNIITMFVVFGVLLLGMMYPLFFKYITRYIYLFKNLYVATFFALTSLFPFFYGGNFFVQFQTLLPLMGYIFFEGFLSQVVLDTKDMNSDGKLGMKTLCVLIGIKKTIYFLYVFDFVGVLVLVLFSGFNTLGIFLVGLTTLFNLITFYLIMRKSKIVYFYHAGKFFLWLCTLLLVNMFV